MNRTLGSLLAMAVIFLIAIACAPVPMERCTTGVAFSRAFHFESDCGGTPLCGFEVVSGTASIASTFHASEHGLRISSASVVRAPIASPTLRRGGERVRLVVRCDSSTSLFVTEVLDVTSATAPSGQVRVQSTVETSVDWAEPSVVFFDLGPQIMQTETTASAVALEFEVLGTGACTVDEIVYSMLDQRCPSSLSGGSGDARTTFDVHRTDATGVTDVRGDIADGALPGGLFAPCRSSAECETGFVCNTAFPGGICTSRCTSDTACGTAGVCDPGFGCLPGCTPHGGLECDRFGAVCFPHDTALTRYACIPSCFASGTTPPSGYRNDCVAATTCDPNTAFCDPGISTGGGVGDPCRADADCASGRCQNNPLYPGGYCFSAARLPSDTAYRIGGPLPRSNCPPGAVVIPLEPSDREGDPAMCLRACDTDADCRGPEYACLRERDATGAALFTNGVCAPATCTAPQYPCFTGYHCPTSTSAGGLGATRCVGELDAGATDASIGDVSPTDADLPDVIDDIVEVSD